MQSTSGVPFTQVGFKGGAAQNGIPVVAQGRAPQDKGGILSTANTTASGAGFGAVLSILPSAPNEFYYGLVSPSGLVAGILQFDASIAQNDPAHANYPLLGQPITVIYEGAVIYNGWNKSATGAIDPVPGAVVMFDNNTGEIQFLASGGSPPGGWTALTNCFVAQVDENGFQGVTLQIRIPS